MGYRMALFLICFMRSGWNSLLVSLVCLGKIISEDALKLVLSHRKAGVVFGQIVRNFSDVCSRSTVICVLQSGNAWSVEKKKRGPRRKLEKKTQRKVIR